MSIFSTKEYHELLQSLRADFLHYTLEEHGAEPARVFVLRPPSGGNMGSTTLVFTGGPEAGRGPVREYITILGDLSPRGNQGVTSRIGYGLGWFARPTSTEHLCEVFMRTEYIPEVGLQAILDQIPVEREAVTEEADEQKRAHIQLGVCLLEEYGHDAAKDPRGTLAVTRNHEAFDEFWRQAVDDDPEDTGMSYPARDAAVLVAIHETFVRLYAEHQKKAAEPRTGAALDGLEIAKRLKLGPWVSKPQRSVREWMIDGHAKGRAAFIYPVGDVWEAEILDPWAATPAVVDVLVCPNEEEARKAADIDLDRRFGGRASAKGAAS